MTGTIASASNRTAIAASAAAPKASAALQRARADARQAAAEARAPSPAPRAAQPTPAQVTRRIEQAGQVHEASRVQQQDFVSRMDAAAKSASDHHHSPVGSRIDTTA